jgi:hypothetical protein
VSLDEAHGTLHAVVASMIVDEQHFDIVHRLRHE